jgi:hypothetical protein|tara:strand:- start:346 stop:639 length:294 start_codon:yes stop_codon:yes gene_type:complete
MTWLTALIKAVLEWLTAEVKKDTKASDADAVPQSLKNRWREKIDGQLEKEKLDYYKFKTPFEGGGEKPMVRLREEQQAKGLGYKPNEKGEWVKHEKS